MAIILDTAEAMFAQHGYNGVTLSEVALAANVHAALMRYYFGDKEHLFKAVFRRRGAEINELRLKAMAEYREAAGPHLELEGIIEAYVRPIFLKFAEDEGWRNYMAIVAYVNSSKGALSGLMAETYHYIAQEFIADLRRIYPKVDEAELYWSYQYVTGALTYSIGQTRRIDLLSDGRVNSVDGMAMLARFPRALAAAIRAICEEPPAPPQRRGAKRAEKPKSE